MKTRVCGEEECLLSIPRRLWRRKDLLTSLPVVPPRQFLGISSLLGGGKLIKRVGVVVEVCEGLRDRGGSFKGTPPLFFGSFS